MLMAEAYIIIIYQLSCLSAGVSEGTWAECRVLKLKSSLGMSPINYIMMGIQFINNDIKNQSSVVTELLWLRTMRYY